MILLALSNVWANKLRAVLTTLGVIIGVTSVILLVSIGEGARNYLAEQFAGLGTNLLIITPGKRETRGIGPGGGNTERKLTLEDVSAIKRQAYDIAGVSVQVFGAGTLKWKNRTRDMSIFGVNHEFPVVRGLDVDIGAFISEQDVESRRRVALIGRTVQREVFGTANPLGKTVKIAGTRFKVIGIIQERGQSLGFDIDDLVFIPVSTAMDMFNLEGVNQILIKAQNKDHILPLMDNLKEIMLRRHDNNEDFTIISQADILRTFNNIAETMTWFLAGIASISLLVGGIGIMNIMLVSVRERTREIGLRKAIGAKERDILLQFLAESVVISMAGGLVGLSLGVGAAMTAQRFFPELPIAVSSWTLMLAVGFSFGVGVFFGVVPARQAAILDPIEALRYE
ncbi:MAG: Macrolide export ATP-binding/permease protein MacB [Myxococcota bacterium]|nr:Macrolide export ATP-binding/permease protein MacB [Myxococcota bacterium]